MLKITILTIGDELLIGQVIDTNSAFMGQALNKHGMEVYRTLTISDTLPEIKSALAICLANSDIVLMTGGLGPTKDDVTKKALAEFFGVGMTFSKVTWERIERFFKQIGRSITPALREQCYMPGNADLLTNKMGTAPGMWMEHEGKIIVSMPGVPYEMKYLLQEEVIPKLLTRYEVRPIAHRTLMTVGEGETRLAAQIEDLEEQLPEHITLAYLPNLGQVRIRLTGRADNAEELASELQSHGDAIRERLSKYVFAEGDQQMAERLGEMLIARKMKMATAESCTGGFIAHKITDIPGSSAYFKGSIVAYDNTVKQQLLGVPTATLEEHGAVSEATVVAMAQGALMALQVDLAVAVSGIAGPGGGSEEKPVGTIWLAVATADRTISYLLNGTKNRSKNIEYAANRALGLVWQFLQED